MNVSVVSMDMGEHVYLYMCTECVYISMCKYAYMYKNMCMFVCLPVNVHTCMCTCLCPCVCIFVGVQENV